MRVVSAFDPTQLPLEGTQLIEASAGTGKTYTIATLFTRLVAESGLEVGEILVVTYTDAAAAELADRIRARLREAALAAEARTRGQPEPKVEPAVGVLLDRADERGDLAIVRDRLHAALYEIDEKAISTIHGFCQRALQENAFESGAAFDLELVGVDRELVTDVAWDEWIATLHAATPGLVDALRTCTIAGRKLGPERIASLIELAGPDPDLPVGIAPEGPPLDPVREAWLEAARGAAEIHADDRAEIERLLLESDGLNKNSYRAPRVREKLPAVMEKLRRASAPGLSRNDGDLVVAMAAGSMKTKKGAEEPEHAFFDTMADLRDADERWKAAQAGAIGLFLREVLERGRAGVARRKSEAGLLFFDDLLRDLALALRSETGPRLAERLRARFAVALIDEFQDTDPLQYEIFHGVWGAAGRPLLLVGDPKQAIYGFRGADVFAYLRAKRDAGGEPRTLDTNYRSDPGLIEAVNTVFASAQRPFLLDAIDFEPVQPRAGAAPGLVGGDVGSAAPFQILDIGEKEPGKAWAKGQAAKEAAKATAADLAKLLRSQATIEPGSGREPRPVRAGDVAVLCRSHAQARLVKSALGAWGVPAIERGDRSVFETREAEELEWVLRGLLAGSDLRRVRAALGTSLVGLSAMEIAALETGSGVEWDALLSRLAGWRKLWEERGVVAALERLLDAFDYVPRTLRSTGGERAVTDTQHVIELLHDATVKERLGPESLVAWLSRQRLDPGARTHSDRESVQIRLESDANAVQLMTVHRSKGLEFPIVYCPFLFDSSLPRQLDHEWTRVHDPDEDDRLILDLGSERHEELLARADVEGIAEGLRLVYVALTRARHRCVVVWGRITGLKDSPLAYLLHQAEGDASEVDAGEWLRLCQARFDSRSKQKLDGAALLAELEALCCRAPGVLDVRAAPVDEPDGRGVDLGAAPGAELSAPVADRVLGLHRRTSSFSGLVSDRAAGAEAESVAPASVDVHPTAEGIDHDAYARALDDGLAEEEPPAREPERLVELAEFPAGAAVGTALHAALEHLDFERVEEEAQRETGRATLARYGVASTWIDRFAAALPGIVATPLSADDADLRLANVAGAQRIDEMEFIVPAAIAADGRSAGASITPQRLAEVFATHASADWIRGYADRLALLEFVPLEGYLKGFVDLVFRWGERFHVVDYKSNLLGPRVEDYAAPRLRHAMIEHDYVLQYHLYVLALHRQVEWRLPGYDYDTHMGDAYYLFLRGMSPDHAPGTGVVGDRPPRALIEALSALFEGRVGEDT